MMKRILLGIVGILMTANAYAKIVTEPVGYQSGDSTLMEGLITYDDAQGIAKPGILIVSDWMGISDFTKEKAEKLAKMGYIVFAADIYGKGVHPRDTKEASEMAGKYLNDRALLQSRIKAAYDKFISMKGVNPNKIVAMGYCFGGTTVLELARSGAPVLGVASFHGLLSNPTPENAKNIKGKVLVMHGADDPNVPPQQVEAFKDEMKKAGVAMEFVAYKGAVHAFTNPKAGNDNSKGVAYNAKADKQSWKKFEEFLKHLVGKNPSK